MTPKTRTYTKALAVFYFFVLAFSVTDFAEAGRTSTRSSVRGTRTTHTRTTRTTATSRTTAARYPARGGVAHGEEGAVAVGRRGAVAVGEEGAAAVGRRGAAAVGEEGAVAVGRRGAVAVGEEGAVGVGRHGGVVVTEERPFYEDYEGWRRVGRGVIVVGTTFRALPRGYSTIVVGSTSYYYHDHYFYTRVMHAGSVSYQVIAPPVGAVITVLPPGHTTTVIGGTTHYVYGGADYVRVSGGYRVVAVR